MQTCVRSIFGQFCGCRILGNGLTIRLPYPLGRAQVGVPNYRICEPPNDNSRQVHSYPASARMMCRGNCAYRCQSQHSSIRSQRRGRQVSERSPRDPSLNKWDKERQRKTEEEKPPYNTSWRFRRSQRKKARRALHFGVPVLVNYDFGRHCDVSPFRTSVVDLRRTAALAVHAASSAMRASVKLTSAG